MKKLLKNVWFWAVVFVLVVLVFSCVNCLSCGTACRCDNGEKLDLTQDFTKDEIKVWKKQNKKDENKYLLNGGYYIHFKGENYPVVFTEGKITRFDNMPDELFFYDIWEFFLDKKLKKRCALLARYHKSYMYGVKHSRSWNGYVLYGNRPKNGTILYFDEENERKISKSEDWTSAYGIDDCLDNVYPYSFSTVFVNNKLYKLKDENGKFLEECNTFRKLYYWAKENGIDFDARSEYRYVAYPSCLFYIEDSCDVWLYDQEEFIKGCSRYWSFDYKEWRSEMKYFNYVRLRVNTPYFHKDVRFTVNYQHENIPSKNYHVIFNGQKVDLEMYSNIIRNDEGQITSYRDGNKNFNVFYGSIEEFNAFLMADNYMDETTKTMISCFSSSDNGSDFCEDFYDSDQGIIEIGSYTYTNGCINLTAVWDMYKTVTLHGNDDSEVNIFKNKEHVLPPTIRKGGYEFKGWYKTSDFKGDPIEIITYDDDFSELFAKFDEVDHYTLSFEPFDGQTFDDITYSYGDEVLLPVLSKAFHAFKGWCTDSALTSEPMKTVTEDFSGSYRLYPCFEPIEFTVTIIDSGAVTEVKLKYGTESYTLPISFVKDGFLGYYDAYGVQYTDETGKSLNPFTDGADIQLFAKYKTEDD